MSGAPGGPPAPEVVAATLRAFLAASGGERASALVDRGDGGAFLVECATGGAAQLTEDGRTRPLLAGAEPLPLPHVHSFGPLAVNARDAEVTAPMGAVAHLAAAVRELAGRLGGRSVVTAAWETTDPEAPVGVSARAGDPIVLALGEEPFPMPEGWP